MAPTNQRDCVSSEGGFTLVEVLVATVIVTVALVSMAELMAITLRMQMLGKNETIAIRLAQSKIDELVNLNFDPGVSGTAVAEGGSLTSDVNGYVDTPLDDGNSLGFKLRWQIDPFPGEPQLRTLTVRVIPTISDRRTNAEIELVTIIRDLRLSLP